MRGILVHQKFKTDNLCCLVVATTWTCTNTKICGCVSLVMISSHNAQSHITLSTYFHYMSIWNGIDTTTYGINVWIFTGTNSPTPQWHHRIDIHMLWGYMMVCDGVAVAYIWTVFTLPMFQRSMGVVNAWCFCACSCVGSYELRLWISAVCGRIVCLKNLNEFLVIEEISRMDVGYAIVVWEVRSMLVKIIN